MDLSCFQVAKIRRRLSRLLPMRRQGYGTLFHEGSRGRLVIDSLKRSAQARWTCLLRTIRTCLDQRFDADQQLLGDIEWYRVSFAFWKTWSGMITDIGDVFRQLCCARVEVWGFFDPPLARSPVLSTPSELLNKPASAVDVVGVA